MILAQKSFLRLLPGVAAVLVAVVLVSAPCVASAQSGNQSGNQPSSPASNQSNNPATQVSLPNPAHLSLASVTFPELGISSSAQPAAEAQPAPASSAPLGAAAAGGFQALSGRYGGTRPFSALGVAAKIGTGGIGFDVATPLSTRLNLRAGAQFFGYSANFEQDGLQYTGTLTLRTVSASLDIFPFKGAFRISPGLTAYNNTNIAATLLVPGGQTFTLNDQDYTSSPTDPIHGTGNLIFGNRTAPRLTVGWGNMVPRSGKHWSFPTEIGFQYISSPVVNLALAGTACSAEGCGNAGTDPDFQSNLKAEQQTLTNDLHPLRFYPIASFGVSYKFGR